MFSFRELVESMEKKTCESAKQKSPSTQTCPQSTSSDEAYEDCEITQQSQTSQCKLEPTDETEDEWERRGGVWEFKESVEERKQGWQGVWRRDKEYGVIRTSGRCENDKMETEATLVKKEETCQALSLKRKHLNIASEHSDFSNDNLYDPAERKCCTLPWKPSPLLDLAHPDRYLNQIFHIIPSQQPVPSTRGPGCEQEHNPEQESPAYSSRRPNKDKNTVSGKRRSLGGNKRNVRVIDNQYKTREGVSLSEKGYSFNFKDETRSDCQRLEGGNLRRVGSLEGSGDTSQEVTSQEFCLHAAHNSSQYFDVWQRKTPRNETLTTAKRLVSHTEGTRSCTLNYSLMPGFLDNIISTAAPLIGDSQQDNSVKYKNVALSGSRTKDKAKVDHEWTTLRFTDQDTSQKSKDSTHELFVGSIKLGGKESNRGTPGNKRKNPGTPFKQSTRSLSKKISTVTPNKQPDEVDYVTSKISQNNKARNRGCRKNKTQTGFPEPQSKDEDTRRNEEPRSASPSPVGFR